MRCQQCDYPLWNLKTRECPECGAPFRPSEFEFVANAVCFCCPHCDQTYYGTGSRGHLEPAAYECVSCGHALHMDDMVLRPAHGVEESRTRLDRMPWLERGQRGRIRSWLATIGLSMTAPHRLMGSVPHDTSLWDAWGFAALTWLVIWLGGATIPLAIIGLVVLLGGNQSDGLEMMAAGLAVAVSGLVLSLLHLLVWGLVTHGILRVMGVCTSSIGRTYQALCYGTGANAIIAIPCLGPYCGNWIGSIWHVVSAVFMVMSGQKVSGGRATFAVLVWPVTALLLSVIGYFGLIMASMMMGPGGGPFTASAVATSEARPLTKALVDYAAANDGQGPDHALRLVTEVGVGTQNFLLQFSDTTEEDVPVGDATLGSFAFLAPNRQGLAVRDVVDALGEGVIAHRLGDYVFTYHGLDFTTADPGLWIIIMSPDPDTGPHDALGSTVAVGMVDGSTTTFDVAELAQALAVQNELRTAADLPPLPDPATVTHGSPARE